MLGIEDKMLNFINILSLKLYRDGLSYHLTILHLFRLGYLGNTCEQLAEKGLLKSAWERLSWPVSGTIELACLGNDRVGLSQERLSWPVSGTIELACLGTCWWQKLLASVCPLGSRLFHLFVTERLFLVVCVWYVIQGEHTFLPVM